MVVVVGVTLSVSVVPTTDVPSLHEKVNGAPPVDEDVRSIVSPAQMVVRLAAAVAPTGETSTVTGKELTEHPVAALVAVAV